MIKTLTIETTADTSYGTDHFKSNAIFIVKGARSNYGPGGFGVSGWGADGEGRIVHGGPKVAGPHASFFGRCGVIASDSRHSTGAEHAAAREAGRFFSVAPGDEIVLAGTTYRVSLDGRRYPRLEVVEADAK